MRFPFSLEMCQSANNAIEDVEAVEAAEAVEDEDGGRERMKVSPSLETSSLSAKNFHLKF